MHLLTFYNYTNTNYNVCKIGAKNFVCIGHKTATLFGPSTSTALCGKKSAIFVSKLDSNYLCFRDVNCL